MKISEGERQAICTVISYGAVFGFGNLISHLQTAWAGLLVAEGMKEKDARAASGGDGYPFKMQADLTMHGEWDETGTKYRKPPKRKSAKRRPRP